MINKFFKKTAIFRYFDRNFRKVEEDLNKRTTRLEDSIKILIEENKKIIDKQLEMQLEMQEKIKRVVEENNYYSSIINKKISQIENVNIELLPYNINTNKLKILVIGFFGAPNTGDELMMQSIINKLDTNNLEITIMIADNQDYVIEGNREIRYIHYPKTHTDINIITTYFDKIVFTGGALLDDKEYENKEVQYTCLYNLLISMGESIIKKGKKLYLVGLSTSNSFKNKEYLEKLNYIAKNAEYFSLRDINSLETLKKYNIDCEKIKIINDLVFSMPNLPYKVEDKIEFVIGIVFVNYVSLDTLLSIIKQVELFLNRNIFVKKKIKLIPFYDFYNADILKYKEIIENYNGNIEIIIEKYESDYNKIVDILTDCDILMGMRYHLSLMGLKLGIPTIHLVYDVHRHYINKMNYLLNLFDVEDYKISLKEYEENKTNIIEEKLEKLYINRSEVSDKTKIISEKIRKEADKECMDIVRNIENYNI